MTVSTTRFFRFEGGLELSDDALEKICPRPTHQGKTADFFKTIWGDE